MRKRRRKQLEDIKVTGLSKVIKEKEVLKDINLSMERGKIYGFYGRNGSGKTMLFRAVCGLIKPTSGEIYIFGKSLERIFLSGKPWTNNRISRVLATIHRVQNLKFLASIKNIISDDEIKEAIRSVGLDPDDKKIYKKYSLGMKQRLGIAQAIMEKPDLIVLDEPTNALDSEGVSLVRNILLKERDRGAVIMIASHNREDIDLLSDEKYMMDNGRLYKVSEENAK